MLPFIMDFHPNRPTRLLDQNFGLGLSDDDMLMPFTIPQEMNRLARHHPFVGYYRPWRSQTGQKDTGSEISIDKDKFQVNLDVQHFNPEEITVKTTGDNVITVEAKHEEKQDEHGYISRQFVRKYVLPKGHDISQAQSKLSSDGVLTITAPKINAEPLEHKTIPIQQTGVPSKAVEKKTENKKN